MTRIYIQIKTIIKDKMSILSFLLPIVIALMLIFLNESSISEVSEFKFGVIESNIKEELLIELEKVGKVITVETILELKNKVIYPSDELIGIVSKEDGLEVLISGDETSYTKDIANHIPSLLDEFNYSVERLETKNFFEEFRNIIYSMVILMALFIGCTFNSMNIVYEKEEGIVHINKILPITYGNFLKEKVIVGILTSVFVSLITSIILIRDFKSLVLMVILIISTSFITSSLGLLIGFISDGVITAISYTKIVLVVFMALPVITHLLIKESEYKFLFNILPSYPVFNGILNIFEKDYSKFIFNIGIILILNTIFIFINKAIYKNYLNN